jgi:tetratricopeptide (TPR) repeat protein
MRPWRVVAAALACAVSMAAWAADADIVAQGEALVRAGRYAEAYKLLEPLEDKLAGDIKFDYLLARSALETGNPSKASFIYERILAVEPNYVGVRLEMGRAYLALGDFARAKLEFETVMRFENLPPDLRQQAEIYGRAAENSLAGRRTVGFGYLEYGYGYDTNPISATKVSNLVLADGSILTLPPSALAHSDHYNAVSTGGEVSHALTNNYSLFLGADLRDREYNNIDIASNYSLDGRGGFGYSEGAHNVRLGMIGGSYWLDRVKTRKDYGWTFDYRYLANKQDQLTFNGTGTRFVYLPDALQINSYDLYQGAGGWLHATEDGKGVASLTLLGGYEKATDLRPDGNKPFYGARLALQRILTSSVGAFFSGGVQTGKYSQINAAFDTTRRDTLYDATVGITWSFYGRWSLRPQVSYFKNKSNIELFEYDRTDASVNVRVDF